MAKNKKKNESNTSQRAAKIAAQRMNAGKKKEKTSFFEYLKGVRLEMKKVVWPTKEQLGSYTVVVLATCAFFALAFWAIDTGFLAILKQLIGLKM